MSETEFTIFWITAFVCLTASYSLFFWFASRCGMFKDQQRARYLPLWAVVPEEPSQFSRPESHVEEKNPE